jgi:hypothetical protein
MENENFFEKTDVHTDAREDILWITAGKYALFMQHGKTGIDAMALFMHYQFTATLQKTNQVWAADVYCRRGLDWGRDRFEKAKALLLELKIIQVHQTKKNGKFDKSYVKIIRGFYNPEENNRMPENQQPVKSSNDTISIDRMSEKPQAGKTTSGKTATNALSNNRNALSNNINASAGKPASPENTEKTTFQKIHEIFRDGSIILPSGEYYRDGKESKHIKLLEARYDKNPQEFERTARQFFDLVKSNDKFWSEQPFSPSAFNSLYNRIKKTMESNKIVNYDEAVNMLADELSKGRQ